MRTPLAIAAGIVAYNPDGNLLDLCQSLLEQGCTVFVHDNGSITGGDTLAACARAGAYVRHGAVNSGIAGGLQSLLRQAEDEAEWLLTFDQDSQIEDDYVAVLSASEAASDPQVAIVAPRVIENATGAFVQGTATQHGVAVAPRVISSGALCRVAALVAVNGFREELFIDYVDYDLCLRLASHGWIVTIEPDAVLHHSIGAQSSHRLFGILPIITSNHSPDRQFYKYRNYMLLTKDGTLWRDPRRAVIDGLALAWGPVKILLFESHKRDKLAAIGSGVVAGLQGRRGPRA